MMKYIYKITIVILFFYFHDGYGQTNNFTKQQISEDLVFLRDQLLITHPNIFIYNSKSDFYQFFEKIEIPEVITENEAYSIISTVSSLIRDGHTFFYPSTALMNSNNEGRCFIPFKVFWDGSNLFIRENYSNGHEIIIGKKIISINGENSQELIQFMLENMMRDGNNYNYPIWVLNNYFFEYYSYFRGCPTEFKLIVETSNGKKTEISAEGLSKSDLLNRIRANESNKEKAIYVEFDLSNSIAILTITDWHNDMLRKYYKQRFKRAIITILEQVKSYKVENLIIDIRNNQGGEPKNSRLLLSHLLEEPFVLVEDYKKIKDGRLIKTNGPQMGFHKPNNNVFKGNLFVLINGGQFF